VTLVLACPSSLPMSSSDSPIEARAEPTIVRADLKLGVEEAEPQGTVHFRKQLKLSYQVILFPEWYA